MKNLFKINKTNLILDNGKIRNCTTNWDKMSVWENILFDFKSYIKQLYSFYKIGIKDFFTCLARILWALFCTITFPIILFIRAIIIKSKARKEIKQFESR